MLAFNMLLVLIGSMMQIKTKQSLCVNSGIRAGEGACGPGSGLLEQWVKDVIKVRAWGENYYYDFGPACRNHDHCYGGGPGLSRRECDENFARDMLNACLSHGPARAKRRCANKARTYVNAVHLFGHTAYNGPG